MSVYIDMMEAPYRGMKMCHMFADTSAELLAMADHIGVSRHWLQNAGTHREHFDVCLSKKRLAIAAGAIEVDARQVIALLRRRR